MRLEIEHHGKVTTFTTQSELWEWAEQHFGTFRAADITEWAKDARIGESIPEYDIIIKGKNFPY